MSYDLSVARQPRAVQLGGGVVGGVGAREPNLGGWVGGGVGADRPIWGGHRFVVPPNLGGWPDIL